MDAGKLLQANLHELTVGPIPFDSLRELEDRGEFKVALILVLDAMSVVSAIAAPTIKTPAESGLLLHLKWVREQLDRNKLYAICWVDTRSMAADGLTKGAVDRVALQDALDGRWQLSQPLQVWRSPMAGRTAANANANSRSED